MLRGLWLLVGVVRIGEVNGGMMPCRDETVAKGLERDWEIPFRYSGFKRVSMVDGEVIIEEVKVSCEAVWSAEREGACIWSDW